MLEHPSVLFEKAGKMQENENNDHHFVDAKCSDLRAVSRHHDMWGLCYDSPRPPTQALLVGLVRTGGLLS